MIAVSYHDSTKHHFNRFARSLGYLDWATQPDPFRRYAGAALRELPREPLATGVPYEALFTGAVAARPIDGHSIGEFLRCSMGLSAWKQYGQSRWALRVNPSSGNLHPTEAWIVHDSRVWHYASREHALEERSVCATGNRADCFLVALTSIVWREAWKYGERAFRYCQHDAGHAIGALRFAAALLGWQMRLLPDWSDAQIAALLGLDREIDYASAEREEAECIAVVGAAASRLDPDQFVQAARGATWYGHANRLSSDRVEWPIIDHVAAATRYPGASATFGQLPTSNLQTATSNHQLPTSNHQLPTSNFQLPTSGPAARDVILQRRSALAFDSRGWISRDRFLQMFARLQPDAPPWDAVDWPPHVHLVLFIHRVEDLTPGVYAYLRDPAVLEEWRSSMRSEFLWEEVHAGLFLLVPIEAGRIANRLSCDQDIAGDGFLALAMLARFEQPLRERGEWFYRRLFWECGLIGQVLYLEAEAAGARATGIGCYYDDPVHELLGLQGRAWQSLYHFSMGLPVEDTRLTSEPGYSWERGPAPPPKTEA